jgi:hypothetical protein
VRRPEGAGTDDRRARPLKGSAGFQATVGFADLDREILSSCSKPDEVEKEPLPALLPMCVVRSMRKEREEKQSA